MAKTCGIQIKQARFHQKYMNCQYILPNCDAISPFFHKLPVFSAGQQTFHRL